MGEEAALRTRQDLVCVIAAFTAVIPLLALWGIATPVELRWLTPYPDATYVIVAGSAGWTDFLWALGSCLVGGIAGYYAWAVLVQRRRPWPLARRRE